jgi:hypothetical protein
MKLILFLTTLFILPEFAFSQTDFRKGFAITNTKDTLTGLIDFKSGFRSYKFCDLKVPGDREVTRYTPGELSGFGFISDKHFESREITGKDQLVKKVFLEVLVKGYASLYRYEDQFFIAKDSLFLHPLVDEVKERMVNGTLVLTHSNRHIATMNMLMSDCAVLQNKIQQLKLNENSLTTLVEKYNTCKGGITKTYKADQPWIKVMPGIVGGLNISKLKFQTGLRHLDGSFNAFRSSIAGISLEVLSPRLSGRLSVQVAALYLKSNYNLFTSTADADNPSVARRDYVAINLTQLKIPFGFKYSFPERKITPYFGLGPSFTYHLRTRSYWSEELEAYNEILTTNTEALSIRNHQIGIWGSVGVTSPLNKWMSFSIEARIENTNGILGSTNLSHSRVTNFQVLMGLRTR